MHVARATILLLAALAACTPDARTPAERRAAAARADSSAAGYEVGVAPVRSATDSGLPPVTSTADSAKRDSAGKIPVTPAGGSPAPTPPRTPVLPPPNPPGRPRVVATTDSGAKAPHRLPPLDPTVEATFLKFDEAKKTATFQLASGSELEGQVSFNGVRRGERVLTIPMGWRLGIEFINRDADLPHSATVVSAVEPIPEQFPQAAFPQAHSVKVDEGLLEGDSDDVSFIADREGRYLIACGVLGHAQRGQWLVLEISATATRPTYR